MAKNGKIESHILIGTPFELGILVSEQQLLKNVKLICFDDADFSLSFKSITEKVLNHYSGQILTVSTFMNTDLINLSKDRTQKK